MSDDEDDNNTTKAIAEAAKEIAKTTRAGIEAGRELGEFIGRIVGPGLIELGGAFGDSVRAYREKNILPQADEINRIHAERGLTEIVPIPPRLGIPYLEAASLEDDETLQGVWARLAANATDPNKRQNLKRVYLEILRLMEPVDWLVITYFVDNGEWDRTSENSGKEIKIEDVAEAIGISVDEVASSLQNLARLGCCRFDQPGEFHELESSQVDNSPAIISMDGEFHLTLLALELVKACEQ